MDLILVMCPQNSYLDPKGSVYMGEKAEILKIRLIDYLSNFPGKKIFFREKRAEADTFFVNDRTHSIVNTFDFQICECLKGFLTLNIDKNRHSGFFETTLEQELKKNHTKSVALVGLETHTSILFTAEELRNRGIDVVVIEPLVVSRDDYMHQVAISLMVNNLGVRLGV